MTPAERMGNQSAAVVFLHIPKTAGTAVHLALAGLFPPGEICPERHPPEFDRAPDEGLRGFRLFSGHFYWDQVARVPAPRVVFTFLREPRERLLSLYYFFRAHRWSVIETDVLRAFSRRRAKEMPIRPYLMSAAATAPDC